MATAAVMSVENVAYIEYMKTFGRLIITAADGSLPKEATDGIIYRGFVDGFKERSMDSEIIRNKDRKREERLIHIGAYREGQRYSSLSKETKSSSTFP